MAQLTVVLLLIVVLVTSTVSGVFGMAGGLMLMGALTLAMPVSVARVTHGAGQFVSNGWRAVLHRKYINWPIILMYGIGSAIARSTSSATSHTWSDSPAAMAGVTRSVSWMRQKLYHAQKSDTIAA